MLVKSFGKPRDSTSVLKALSGKLDIERHSPSILYLSSLVALPGVLGTVVGDSLFIVSCSHCLPDGRVLSLCFLCSI